MDDLKLNLGCGDKPIPGFINIDIIGGPGITKLDLNKRPLPFKDNSVAYIFSSNALEHLKNPTELLLDLHRICKSEAIIDFYLPHFSLCANHADLTHERVGFSYLTFGHPAWNKEINRKFKTLKKKIIFTRANFKFLNYIFNPLINAAPVFYERFFTYLLPASQIHFRLQVVK